MSTTSQVSKPRTSFLGYKRSDGSVGIRNHVLIMSTVACSNETARRISQNVEHCVFVSNAKGCGQIGQGMDISIRTLVGLACNPNVHSVVLIGLGCESTKASELVEKIQTKSHKHVEVLMIQEEGGVIKTIEKATSIARALVKIMLTQKRVRCNLSELILATNCGGSDATSGLSSNPILGQCSDRMVALGGIVLLGETTELIGTEHILMGRADNEITRRKIKAIIVGLEKDLAKMKINFRGANPGPGNMKGGLSTLEEKALGGINKGGTTTINEVIRYSDRPTKKGLIIMDTPGFDIESVTGMVAGGAQLCVFTTGRGTPIGNPLVPVIKVCGNSDTFLKMGDHIDLDVSSFISGERSMDSLSSELMDLIIEICNGKLVKAEELGFGEISIYRNSEIWCSHI